MINTPDTNTLTPSLNKQAKARSIEAVSASASAAPDPTAKEAASVQPSAAARTVQTFPALVSGAREAPVPAQQADASIATAQGAAKVPVQSAKPLARSDAAPTPAPQALARMATPQDAGASLRLVARTGDVQALQRSLPTTSPAQFNSIDAAGRSALMLATAAGQLRAVQLLMAAGADAAVVDLSGENALQIARRLGLKQIEAALTSP